MSRYAIHTNKVSIHFGYTQFKSFGIGIHVDRWSIGVDLGPFWIGVEW
jgi:hypothetical protein